MVDEPRADSWRACPGRKASDTPVRAAVDVTGLPAIAVCAGFGDADLPASIQLAGYPFAEQTVAFHGGLLARSRQVACQFVSLSRNGMCYRGFLITEFEGRWTVPHGSWRVHGVLPGIPW